jgi:hypothetical protein
MPLHRLLQNRAFEPPQLEAMAYAFESICQQYKLLPVKDDQLRELVALTIIELAQSGVVDAQRLRDLASSAIKLSNGRGGAVDAVSPE